MAKKKIFISYDYDNDKHYKNLLVAWDKNDLFDFDFYDNSVDVSVNSTDANYIKQVITNRIKSSNQVLVIIGGKTNKSGWVEWEINKASQLGKKLIGVKTNSTNDSPSSMFGKGASWAMSFTFENIKKALDN